MPNTPQEQALEILKDERDRLSTLIALMESSGARTGRKKDMPIALSVPRRRGVRKWSAAQRKAASERTRARWAVRKQATQKKTAKGGRKKAKRESLGA